jgi:hypothetical protein
LELLEWKKEEYVDKCMKYNSNILYKLKEEKSFLGGKGKGRLNQPPYYYTIQREENTLLHTEEEKSTSYFHKWR